MRLAYVSADPGVPVFGRKGCSVHVQEVLRAILRTGASADLFATRFDGLPPRGLEAVNVHALPEAPKGELASREQACYAANSPLAAALVRQGPYDAIYERYSLFSYAAMEYARLEGVPGILEVNAPLIEEQAAHRGLADRDCAESVVRRVFAAASVIVSVSDPLARYLGGYPETHGKVVVAPNGVAPDRYRPGLEPALPAPPGWFTVGFVGTLKPWHGLDVLVDAFDRLHREDSRTRLLVVGHGSGREVMEARIAGLGLAERVHFTGAVEPEQVPALLASMDAAVAPYEQCDGFYFSPLKLYEYLAAGLPVVASRIGQVEEVVEHGINGLLCPPGDARGVADALIRLRRDSQLARGLGTAARARVIERHTWDGVVQRILREAGLNRPVGAAA
jgi:glycosyltransferase involved in cell wall biosynthesis